VRRQGGRQAAGPCCAETAPAQARKAGDEHGAGGALASVQCPAFPAAPAGTAASCCPRDLPSPTSRLLHGWIRVSLGEEGKPKSRLYFEMPFGMCLGFVPLGSPDGIAPSHGESLLLCQWPVPRRYQLVTCSHRFSHLHYPCNSCCICTEHVQPLT